MECAALHVLDMMDAIPPPILIYAATLFVQPMHQPATNVGIAVLNFVGTVLVHARMSLPSPKSLFIFSFIL